MGQAPEAGNRPCPTPTELAAFLRDELSPEVMDDIGAHVSGCRHCDAAIRRMDETTAAGAHGRQPPQTAAIRAPGLNNGWAGDAGRARAATLPRPLTLSESGSPPFQIGQYRLGERLGRGGMGAVYRAEHVRLKKPVAVKVLSPDQTRDRRAVARFQLEMEGVGRLDHPNIVRATDAGEVDGVHFLVMELIEGINLAHLLLRRGPLAVPEACELVRQAAAGLQHAHEHGLVHRDIKPSNLMLSTSGRVKILDLGLALLRSGGVTPDLTGVGEVMGTAEYMAPEQWIETHAVDIRADIYSLGCTLYALLTGDPPFTGSGRRSALRMMAAHQRSAVPLVEEVRTDVPAAVSALLTRMLAKDPGDRPATPGELAAELAPLAAGADLSRLSDASLPITPAGTTISSPGFTPTPRPTASARIPAHRGRGQVLAASLVAVVAVAVSVYAIAGGGYPRTSRVGTPPSESVAPPDPKKWRSLLATPPGQRLWDPTVRSLIDHKPDKELLFIQSPRWALLSLGDTEASGYRLQVGFQQDRWPGGIGIYFGGKSAPGSNVFTYQVLQLRHIKAGNGRDYGLVRSRGESLLVNQKPEVSLIGFATTFLTLPDNEEQLLEIEVTPNGLAVVRWNGAACPELVGESALKAAEKLLPGGHLTGEFGIFCNGAAVTVTTARYVATE